MCNVSFVFTAMAVYSEVRLYCSLTLLYYLFVQCVVSMKKTLAFYMKVFLDIDEQQVLFQFVMVIGDCHLRSFVDGYVAMPEGQFSFGFMSAPGGDVNALRMETCHDPPLNPDVVCLLAPGNNLKSSRTI